MCVKFENLIGPNGGGDKHKQEEAVKSICNHILIESNQDQLEDVCNKIYSVRSSTFNKGKIGNWNRILSEEEKKWLNDTIRSQITLYGYI